MAELLLELFSEEIPARMQADAAKRLQSLLAESLKASRLAFETLETHAGPRRLVAVVRGLPAQTTPTSAERKGPRTSAPKAALDGFCKSAGLDSIQQAKIIPDKKGDFYLAITETPGQPTAELLLGLLPETIKKMTWPKSMRWDGGKTSSNRFRWVRPLRRILCLFDGKIVPFEMAGLTASNETEGHRVMGAGPFVVSDFEQYERTLREQGHVILRAEERRNIILKGAHTLCDNAGYELVEDVALLQELVGLAEWPVPLMGKMDNAFLDLPEEIIVQAMRQHQKYFAVRQTQVKGKLAPRFVVVANLSAADDGKAIVKGNERVLSARLADARFFWEEDCKTKLEHRFEALEGLVFYQPKKDKVRAISLNSKTKTVINIAGLLAQYFPPQKQGREEFKQQVERAACLSKCDLLTQTVNEFPALQGKIGRLLALRDGETQEVAEAISGHYCYDSVENVEAKLIAAYVALAEHLVVLSSLWIAGERVTGSGDPYGMRRAALGIVQILLFSSPAPQSGGIFNRLKLYPSGGKESRWDEKEPPTLADLLHAAAIDYMIVRRKDFSKEVIDFIAERHTIWRGAHKETPASREFVQAAWRYNNSLAQIDNRAQTLQSYFTRGKYKQDCAALVAAYRRAVNILNKEKVETLPLDSSLLAEPEEKALYEIIQSAASRIDEINCKKNKNFDDDMQELTRLRAPLDNFFNHVRVNDENPKLRHNRLALLTEVRKLMHQVADFSQIQLKGRD